jgi:hypothetical protein
MERKEVVAATGIEGGWIWWSPEQWPLTARKEKRDGEHGLVLDISTTARG